MYNKSYLLFFLKYTPIIILVKIFNYIISLLGKNKWILKAVLLFYTRV